MIAAWVYDDGGREAAGFKGTTDDCVTRAVAIATGIPYRDVYDAINLLCKEFPERNRSARTGVSKKVTREMMKRLGWEWHPTMQIGTGCTVHVRADELPAGRLVLQLSRHVAAFVDGVLRDNHDSSRGGSRCVYGYWTRERVL